MVVSRSDPNFLIGLFKLEVPEIESGVLEVKAVAREAGSRSKMAVVSHQDGVDAIGSCVGQRGVRIANVMNELGEEKIDIIEWDEDEEKFIANSLSPAKIDDVKVEGDTATVTVPNDQLSLAIGREGQNVRLAWKLTGYKIDILPADPDAIEKEEEVKKVEEQTEEEVKEKVEEQVEEKKDEEVKEEVVEEKVEEVKPEEDESPKEE